MYDPINVDVLGCPVELADQFRSLPNRLIHDILGSTELKLKCGGRVPQGWRWGKDVKAGMCRGEGLREVDMDDVPQDIFRSLDRAGEGELVDVDRVGLGEDSSKTVGQVLTLTPNHNCLAGIFRFRHDDCAVALRHDVFHGHTSEQPVLTLGEVHRKRGKCGCQVLHSGFDSVHDPRNPLPVAGDRDLPFIGVQRGLGIATLRSCLESVATSDQERQHVGRDFTDPDTFGGPRRDDFVNEEAGFFSQRTGSLDGDRDINLLFVLFDNQRNGCIGRREGRAIGSGGRIGRGRGQPIPRRDIHTGTGSFPNMLQVCACKLKLSEWNQEVNLTGLPLAPMIEEMVDAGAWTIKVTTGEQAATSAFLALSNSFWDSDFK